MSAATFAPDFYEHQTEPGLVRAVLLALVMHGLLGALLFYGIRWQSGKPEVAEAELVVLPSYSLPRAEVKPEPKPVEREPEPVVLKPEIVIKAPEPPPKKERELPKAPPKARVEPPPKDDIRKLLDKELQRDPVKEAMEKEDRGGVAARAGAEAAQRGTQEWGNAIRSRAYSRMRDYEGAGIKGTAVVEVTVLPSYEVLSVRLVSSSGNPEFDADAERAVRAISPLPRPKDDASFQRVLKLNFRARN